MTKVLNEELSTKSYNHYDIYDDEGNYVGYNQEPVGVPED